jgi:hypothetical protein
MLLHQIFADTNEITNAAILIPVITGIVQALKMIGMQNKFAPLAAIGIGAGLAVLLRQDVQSFTNAIFTGIIFGLSSSGLYSGLVHSLNVGNKTNPTTAAASQQPEMLPPDAENYPTTTTALNDGTNPQTTIILDEGASIKPMGDGMKIETEKGEK